MSNQWIPKKSSESRSLVWGMLTFYHGADLGHRSFSTAKILHVMGVLEHSWAIENHRNHYFLEISMIIIEPFLEIIIFIIIMTIEIIRKSSSVFKTSFHPSFFPMAMTSGPIPEASRFEHCLPAGPRPPKATAVVAGDETKPLSQNKDRSISMTYNMYIYIYSCLCMTT